MNIEIISDQIKECIEERTRYSTVWNGIRVIINPELYRKMIVITAGRCTEEFGANEIDKMTNHIIKNINL